MRWQKNADLPPNICAFGDLGCHRSEPDWHFQPPSRKATAGQGRSQSTCTAGGYN